MTDDDGLLLKELQRRGVEALPVVWDDAAVSWETYHRVVIRSCWDYHRRLPEFFAWLERLEGQGVPLWNPPTLVRWNARKTYLRELERAGARVVPTVWLEQDSAADLTEPPPASVVSQARAVAALIPGPWAYARIDGVAAGEAFTLMEVELIEPYLFLSEQAMAAARLADAILSKDPLGRSAGAG